MKRFLYGIFICLLLSFVCSSTLSNHNDNSDNVPLRPRQLAPLFTSKAVLKGEFIDIKLKSYIDQGKWIVLLFYPFDFTFVCPTEILAFNDKLKEFEKLN